MENFPKRLQKLLSSLNWTQLRLSQATGITEQTISRWMTSGDAPSMGSLKKISKATGCNPEWISSEDYQGPILEKGRWAFEADEKLGDMSRREIGLIYSRLKEIKESRNFNSAQLLEAAGINIHATEDDPNFLGLTPRGRHLEKIGAATGYDKSWILSGIGPKYTESKVLEEKSTKKEEPELNQKILEMLLEERAGRAVAEDQLVRAEEQNVKLKQRNAELKNENEDLKNNNVSELIKNIMINIKPPEGVEERRACAAQINEIFNKL